MFSLFEWGMLLWGGWPRCFMGFMIYCLLSFLWWVLGWIMMVVFWMMVLLFNERLLCNNGFMVVFSICLVSRVDMFWCCSGLDVKSVIMVRLFSWILVMFWLNKILCLFLVLVGFWMGMSLLVLMGRFLFVFIFGCGVN